VVASEAVAPPSDQPQRKPWELLRRAAFNQYNAILMGGVGAFSVATGSWLPLVVGAGAEVLWLVLGADSKPFKNWVTKQEEKEAADRVEREVARIVADLDPAYVARYETLRQTSLEIQGLASENKGLDTSLLKDEMQKLGQLLYSFLQMSVSHQKLSRYLTQSQASQIEYDISQCQRALAGEKDPRVQASLKQAYSLAQKRLRQNQQIQGAYKALGVQMLTLEKAFDYLKSNILGMGTREELAKELDGLVTGVASAAELDAYTSDFDQELEPSRGAKVVRLASKR
jgi:hypothetical protein